MSVSPGPEPGSQRQESALVTARWLSAATEWIRVLIVAQFVLTFITQGERIPSASMEPTLEPGDFVLVNKLAFARGHGPSSGPVAWFTHLLAPGAVRRGSLIVFRHPLYPQHYLAKRVVAVPGDRLRLEHGRVLIDNVAQPEPYAYFEPGPPDTFRDHFPDLHGTDPEIDAAWWVQLRRTVLAGPGGTELRVPPGAYMALGDNRNDSEDSRYWGFVRRADIEGCPALVYFVSSPAKGDGADLLGRLRRGLAAAHRLR